MKVLIVVYSRLSSSRLPKKALMHVNGRPLFEHVAYSLEELKNLGDIIIGTSTDPSDDQLVKQCIESKIEFFRGDLNNVALRTQQIIDYYQPDFICRVCGDRALLTPDFLNYAKNKFDMYHTRYSLISNLNSKFDPKGLKIEFIKCDVFSLFRSKFNEEECEHITKYFYNKEKFDQSNIYRFDFNKVNRRDVSLCVDTDEDLYKVNKLLKTLIDRKTEYSHNNVYSILKNV